MYLIDDCITYFESSSRVFNHVDMMTREVFMPLLCLDQDASEHGDQLMDIMHRIMSQISLTQSQIEVD